MKLLLAVTVAEYKEKLQEFFSNHNITSYNEFDVTNVNKPDKNPHRLDNWFFGNNAITSSSIAFFTIVQDEQAQSILDDLNQCKTEMPNCNIQAFILNIENTL